MHFTVHNNELKETSSNLGVFGTPYTVAENFIAKEDGFLNLTINPTSSDENSFVQLQIGTRYIAGNGGISGNQYNVFTCVKKSDKVTIAAGYNANRQTWIFIPLSGNK